MNDASSSPATNARGRSRWPTLAVELCQSLNRLGDDAESTVHVISIDRSVCLDSSHHQLRVGLYDREVVNDLITVGGVLIFLV